MSVRLGSAFLALLTTILLASACGSAADLGDSEVLSTDAPADTTEVAAPASEPTALPAEQTAAPAPEPEEAGDPRLSGDCQDAISIDEWDALFGTTIQSVSGAGMFCNVIYADDSVGSFIVMPERRHDSFFEDNARSMGNAEERGIIFDDGRGYLVDRSVATVGDSGLLYSMVLPDNAGPEDPEAALLAFVDLYMAR